MNNDKKMNWIIILLVIIVLILLAPVLILGGTLGFMGAQHGSGQTPGEFFLTFLLGIATLVVLIWGARKIVKKEMTYKLAVIIGLSLWAAGIALNLFDGEMRPFNLGFIVLAVTALIWAVRTLLNKD